MCLPSSLSLLQNHFSLDFFILLKFFFFQNDKDFCRGTSEIRPEFVLNSMFVMMMKAGKKKGSGRSGIIIHQNFLQLCSFPRFTDSDASAPGSSINFIMGLVVTVFTCGKVCVLLLGVSITGPRAGGQRRVFEALRGVERVRETTEPSKTLAYPPRHHSSSSSLPQLSFIPSS